MINLHRYDRKIERELKKAKGSKLLLALSGGKDSLAVAHAIHRLSNKYDLKFECLFIDLDIKGHSEKASDFTKKFCKKFNLKLNLLSIKKKYNLSIDEIAKSNPKRSVCGICGVIKRYVMNRFAFEHGFEWLVTGHNLDDISAAVMLNLGSQNIEQLKRIARPTPPRPELKIVGRLKPAIFITSEENKRYCEINGIAYYNGSCPYTKGATLAFMKELLKMAEKRIPNIKIGIIKSLRKLEFPKFETKIEPCRLCGYPTVTEICAFCKILKRYERK